MYFAPIAKEGRAEGRGWKGRPGARWEIILRTAPSSPPSVLRTCTRNKRMDGCHFPIFVRGLLSFFPALRRIFSISWMRHTPSARLGPQHTSYGIPSRNNDRHRMAAPSMAGMHLFSTPLAIVFSLWAALERTINCRIRKRESTLQSS